GKKSKAASRKDLALRAVFLSSQIMCSSKSVIDFLGSIAPCGASSNTSLFLHLSTVFFEMLYKAACFAALRAFWFSLISWRIL
ncbi:MAG TPA: hypothetical protein PLV58_04305, partial [Campylobacterales bacterium]|nr:hypothetical protein [Campylobacterales bacterium]